jgi:hypothetical protein
MQHAPALVKWNKNEDMTCPLESNCRYDKDGLNGVEFFCDLPVRSRIRHGISHRKHNEMAQSKLWNQKVLPPFKGDTTGATRISTTWNRWSDATTIA